MATSYDVNDTSDKNCFQRLLTSLEQRAISFGKFIYSDGKVIGRTAASWGKIGLFYMIYYACLAAFFATTMAVFYKTTEWEYPKLQGTDSLLKDNPGMGFRPMPQIGSTLIRLTKGDSTTYQQHIDRLTAFLSYYNASEQIGDDFMSCKDNALRPREDWTKSCVFDVTKFGTDNPCTKENSYGFASGTPCVLLKLNKVYAWLPKPFINGTDKIPSQVSAKYDVDQISVHCAGEYKADKDNIGKVHFYPPGGFPYTYYPYLNQKGYRQPLVFAHFSSITNGLVVMVNCQAYAKNIEHNKRELKGSIHFELYVE